MTTDLDFLRELCAAPAPTGFEAPAQEVFRRRLSALGAPQGDPLGNVWADAGQGGAPALFGPPLCAGRSLTLPAALRAPHAGYLR